MVNLRYHVVTLVAVFLALAVGVFLGAGPLQNRINSVGEGTNLKEEVDQLQASVEELQVLDGYQQTFISGIAGELLPGSLNGTSVTLILLPDTDPEDVQALVTTLTNSGASVEGQVELTENWVAVGQREYRDTLAVPVAGHLSTPPDSESADAVLARALVEVLTTSGAEQTLVKEILADPQTALVEPGTFPDEPVTTLVLVGADKEATAPAEDESDAVVMSTLVTLADAAANAPGGAVAVGSADGESAFITALRSAGTPIATVDQAGTEMAWINVALVLATGSTGDFGQGVGATSAVAPLP